MRSFFAICLLLIFSSSSAQDFHPALLPYPQELVKTGESFVIDGPLLIAIDKKSSAAMRFAGNDLRDFLNQKLHLDLNGKAGGKSILLTLKNRNKSLGEEGYSLEVTKEGITISANTATGIFYGVQTLKQLLLDSDIPNIPGVKIRDWPDTRQRAMHYDTKHHQDTKEYVKQFIREMASMKANMLVWEWEDKFEYPSHPEVGAPGAFTISEMKEITGYAAQYHVQLVPLVQGLGHASFILKWPQFAHLREVPASNFEFCPLKDSSYLLLFALWKDAMDATPGSGYFHIGSDETYELGYCPDCRKKEAEIGKSGLYHLFLEKSAKFIEQNGRKMMAWEAPMGWAKGRINVYHANEQVAEKSVTPHKGIILTESYDYETPDLKFAKMAKSLGHPVYAYDPNPGIEQLFLPYYFIKSDDGKILPGCFENSFLFLQETLAKGVFEGVIRTSWDDSGLPMNSWTLCFATTAALSWNVDGVGKDQLLSDFYKSYYGKKTSGVDTLYRMLNEGAYFYMESFEREVWAWGEIGKTHIPDLPRGDAIEYDPYWNTQYKDRVVLSKIFLSKMDSAIRICDRNLSDSGEHAYDLEVFRSLARMVRHTASTYLSLSSLEKTIRQAHLQRFSNTDSAMYYLDSAQQLLRNNLSERKNVFDDLVEVWNRSRLPKGMSTPQKTYFFEQDRTRHFANRVADMSYLVIDEEQLGLERYLENLEQYTSSLKKRFAAD